jgi:hypothetical protein
MSSSTLINIGGNIHDPHYRYKREKIKTIFNKDSTTLINISQISKQLNVEPSQITNYLQKKCGMTIFGFSIRSKVKINEDAIEKQLENFIKDFVLCPKCKLPELKNGECSACQYSSNTNYLEKIEIDDKDDKPPPEKDVIISKIMHYLYDLLEEKQNFNETQLAMINKCLDYCWNEESENDPLLKIKKINSKLIKNNIKEFDIKSLVFNRQN